MDPDQADKVIELLGKISDSLAAMANSQYIIADRLARLVQLEENRLGMAPAVAGFDHARWESADPYTYGGR